MAAKNKIFHFKIVLLGDQSVGKSSTVERFVKGEFFEFRPPTIGAAYLAQSVALETCTVKLEIWDTAGQERYRALAPMYYRGAAAALVIYDITSRDSYAGAKTWIDELKSRTAESESLVIALVGNKSDLEHKREVPATEGSKYATELGCLWFETSAKTGDNITEIFTAIARKLPESSPTPPVPVEGHDTEGIKGPVVKPGGKKCCK